MKNFLALLIFLGTAGYVGWYFYTKQITTRIQEMSPQIAPLEQLVAQKRAELAAFNTAIELNKKAVASRQALAILNERQKALNEEKTTLLQQRQKQASTSRESLVGVVLTELTLADGRRLTQARVTKVDDTGVTFALSSGILRVTARDLTPELRDYFRLK